MAVLIGGAVGYGVYLISGKDRARAYHTLGIAYGDSISMGQKREIIRNLFINFGKNIGDVIRFKRHYHRQIKDLIDVEGIEHFDRVYKRGKGVIAVTGHIGNFELLAAFFVSSGYRAAVIGRELYDRRLDRLLVENREAIGIVNISTQDSPRRILKALKDGYALGVLIDTDSMRVRSEFVPAFGRLSYTPVGQSILGLKTGAGFVPMACVRKGRRYKVIVRPEITVERTNDFDKDVYNITKKCTEALEEIINEHKDQWIWIHNRWLTRPQ
jgi:KDO2-lipid IV(A) lauroyltransferase